MAAALQQTPITLQSRLPLSTRITAKFLAYRTTTRVQFHGGGFSSSAVNSPKLAVRHNGKSRGSTLIVRAFDSPAESYASALADVAVENETLEATAADLEKVAKLFSDPEVSEFFSSPVILFDQKQEVLISSTKTFWL